MLDGTAKVIGDLVSGVPFGPSIDWPLVVRRAIDERMAPLLFSRLGRNPALPDESRGLLRSELYRAEAWNLIQYRGLGRILERARSAGLDSPVVLKGGALAATLYEEIGHRPMSDIDVLVPRDTLPRWIDLAREASFRRLSPAMARGLEDSIHYHVALVEDPGNEAMVEIHYGLIAGESDWRAPDLGWFFDRTESFRGSESLPPLPVRQLQPTAHLLYLAAHAVLQHGASGARMIWFHDVHLLVERCGASIRWSELVSQARALGWDAALGAALDRSRALFGTEIPEGIRKELPVEGSDRGSREVRRRSDPRRSRAELVWSELRSASPGNCLRWSLAILLPQPEYMRWRYPQAGHLWPFLYPYRWGRVLWEGFRALVGSRARRPAG